MCVCARVCVKLKSINNSTNSKHNRHTHIHSERTHRERYIITDKSQ